MLNFAIDNVSSSSAIQDYSGFTLGRNPIMDVSDLRLEILRMINDGSVADHRAGYAASGMLMLLEAQMIALKEGTDIDKASSNFLNNVGLLLKKMDALSAIANVSKSNECDSNGNVTLQSSISKLDISVRTLSLLKIKHINNISDLIRHSRMDLFRMQNVGCVALDEIDEALVKAGFTLSK